MRQNAFVMISTDQDLESRMTASISHMQSAEPMVRAEHSGGATLSPIPDGAAVGFRQFCSIKLAHAAIRSSSMMSASLLNGRGFA